MIREILFDIARRDISLFLKDHEDELLLIFREEIQRIDDEIPEEQSFIDIRMVPLGDVIFRGALRAVHRFLNEGLPDSAAKDDSPPDSD